MRSVGSWQRGIVRRRHRSRRRTASPSSASSTAGAFERRPEADRLDRFSPPNSSPPGSDPGDSRDHRTSRQHPPSIDDCQYVGTMRLIQEIDQTCCPPLVGSPLSETEAERLAEALRVIAEPARLRLVSLISASQGGESCVCDLTDQLDLGQPTVSHHLKVLTDAGILHREKRGRWAYYRIEPEPLQLLRGALDPRTA